MCSSDLEIRSQQNFVSQRIEFIACYIPVASTITGVKWFQTTKGVYTGNNTNGVALYSYSSGTLTKVAESTNDLTIWSTPNVNTYASKAFSSTYSASVGIYFIALLYSNSAQTTAPQIGIGSSVWASSQFAFDFTNSVKLNMYANTQTAFGSTYAVSSLPNGSPWIVWLY